MASVMLSVRNLSMSYPRARRFRAVLRHPFRHPTVRALRDLTFQAGRGEIVTFVGPNGAGKSTLCRALAGLLMPGAGSVELAGAAARGSEQLRERVGLCANEERSFLWRLGGRENLRLFAALNGLTGRAARTRVDELVDRLHIGGLADQPFMYWSTGMRQRLNLARSLLGTPDVLILDEPTRSLDPLAAQELRILVKHDLARRQGMTVVWCTHILSEVADLESTIGVLRQGELVAYGDSEAITSRRRRDVGASRAGGETVSMPASALRQTEGAPDDALIAALHELLANGTRSE
jgi:ABC-2 type transport system ATP-binding protein